MFSAVGMQFSPHKLEQSIGRSAHRLKPSGPVFLLLDVFLTLDQPLWNQPISFPEGCPCPLPQVVLVHLVSVLRSSDFWLLSAPQGRHFLAQYLLPHRSHHNMRLKHKEVDGGIFFLKAQCSAAVTEQEAVPWKETRRDFVQTEKKDRSVVQQAAGTPSCLSRV